MNDDVHVETIHYIFASVKMATSFQLPAPCFPVPGCAILYIYIYVNTVRCEIEREIEGCIHIPKVEVDKRYISVFSVDAVRYKCEYRLLKNAVIHSKWIWKIV